MSNERGIASLCLIEKGIPFMSNGKGVIFPLCLRERDTLIMYNESLIIWRKKIFVLYIIYQNALKKITLEYRVLYYIFLYYKLPTL